MHSILHRPNKVATKPYTFKHDSQSSKVRSAVYSGGVSAYLTSAESNNEVSNGRVLSLTATMRHHYTPACLLWHLTSLNRLSHWTDLIHFQQQAVASLLINGLLNSLWIGHRQVIAATTNDAFHWQRCEHVQSSLQHKCFIKYWISFIYFTCIYYLFLCTYYFN